MARNETVVVLGAGGTMGLGMAGNLARSGFAVRAWNRTREKAEPLTGDGVSVFDTPAEAADGAGVLITILSDADAVLSAIAGEAGALSHASEGTVWLQMSTVGLEGFERCAEAARQHGVALVDVPVLGTKGPAEAGELVVLASGPSELEERLAPIFDAVGKRTLWVGEAGKGTRLKMAVNAWILSVVEGVAETIALAEGLGVDPRLVLDALSGGPLDLPYLQMKGKAMIERSFEPSFKLALAAKDARLMAEAAEQAGLDLPLVEAIRRRMEEGVAEHGEEDMAATYLSSARTAQR